MTAVALHQPETQHRSVIVSMADQYGMRADAFEATLRATIVPKACTREEFAAFILVAKQYHLNPITREIYAIPKKGGGIQPVVGVDGWYHLMNSHPQFDGIEFEDIMDEQGAFAAVTCRIWRKDRSRPVAVTEYLAECRQPTEPWTKWPRRMTRHKAGIQAARIAFGFSGIVDPDEADRFTEVTPPARQMASPRRTSAQVRQLQTIDSTAHEPIIDDEIPDFAAGTASSAASPAVSNPAGEPPASDFLPDAGGDPEVKADPVEEAREAGRKACREGGSYDAVPPKYARYKNWRAAWEDGFEDEGKRMEAELVQ